jgi:hypothetical protein
MMHRMAILVRTFVLACACGLLGGSAFKSSASEEFHVSPTMEVAVPNHPVPAASGVAWPANIRCECSALSIAYKCHCAGAILFGLMGLAYLGRKEFMPYHAIALGKKWNELDRSAQILFLTSMKIIGSTWLAFSVSLGILLLYGFRSGQSWAVMGVPATGLMASVPTLLAVLHVKARTPASPPWLPLAVAASLFLAGLILSIIGG